jgi:hypothetical protein
MRLFMPVAGIAAAPGWIVFSVNYPAAEKKTGPPRAFALDPLSQLLTVAIVGL